MRTLARVIDGRISLGIEIRTEPKIGLVKEIECIKHGLDAMERAVNCEVKHTACMQSNLQNANPLK